MNWAAIHLAARLAQTAYISDLNEARDAFALLGFIALSQYKDDSHQAYVLFSAGGEYTLAISGTRFGHSIGDVLSDADIVPMTLNTISGDLGVSRGTYEGLDKLWTWARSLAPSGEVWTVLGHSLGGERALLLGIQMPPQCVKAVYAFEAPKCADAATWRVLKSHLDKSINVVNGNDLWFGWPFVSEWSHPPVSHIHLLENHGEYAMIDSGEWPHATSAADHDISLVIERLGMICSAPALASAADAGKTESAMLP
jgi:hypothetical protein